jgi:hypothetical protein
MHKVLSATAALGVGLLFATPSSADIYIGLQQAGVNGGALTEEAHDSLAPGWAVFAGGYGTFFANIVTGTAPPTSINPLDSSALDISAGSTGVLTVYVSATNLTVSGATEFTSTLTSNALQPGWTTQLSTYWSTNGTTPYQKDTLLGDNLFKSSGTDTDMKVVDYNGFISVTGVYVITANGSGTVNSTIGVASQPIPKTGPTDPPIPIREPTSLMLLGGSLLAAGLFLRRRKQTEAAEPA